MADIFEIEHPRLGRVKGCKTSQKAVIQCLGIPYATISHRFAAPVVKTQYGGTVDATTFGSVSVSGARVALPRPSTTDSPTLHETRPSVVASPIACDIEFGLIQRPLNKPSPPPVSDLEGLNLNITIPTTPSDDITNRLPVLVFIHGGGFVLGGTWAPHCDLAAIVGFSQSTSMPIIGVSINYRLGIPGFLDSAELRAAGAPPNRGLMDQKAAFQWLRQNIGGFGGDPERITAVGQSAGGSSIQHLFDFASSGEVPFSRAVCLSGNKLDAAVFPESVAQTAYGNVLQCLGIASSLSADDQLAALITVPPESLLERVRPSVPLGPVVERARMPRFGALKAHLSTPQHRMPLMIGSTDFDGAIFEVLGLFKDRDPSTLGEVFTEYLMKTVSPDQHANIQRCLNIYGISPSVGGDVESIRVKILQFGTDLKYFASSHEYADSWPAYSWLYHFRESNPWDGRHKGRSAHCLDIAYLFLNYKAAMSESQQRVALAFASDVIRFTNEEAPWSEFHSSGKMRVYGQLDDGQFTEENFSEAKVGPSRELVDLWSEIGLDNLVQAWDAYYARL